jgi:hypothetical protein
VGHFEMSFKEHSILIMVGFKKIEQSAIRMYFGFTKNLNQFIKNDFLLKELGLLEKLQKLELEVRNSTNRSI